MKRLFPLFFCLTSLAASETLPPLVAGPWITQDDDGAYRIAAEFGGTFRPLLAALVQVRAGQIGQEQRLEISPQVVPLQRPVNPPTTVVAFRLDAKTAEQRLVFWVQGMPSIPLSIPTAPKPGEPVRVLIVHPRAWPNDEAMENMEKDLGGPFGIVVSAGQGRSQVVGRTSWERRTLLALPEHNDEETKQMEVLAGHQLRPQGWRWGDLHLAVIRKGNDPARSFAAGAEASTRVGLLIDESWRADAASNKEQRDPQICLRPVLSALAFHCPLLIGIEGDASALSFPLQLGSAGTLVPAGQNGVRILAGLPGGGILAPLCPMAHLPIQEILPLTILHANNQTSFQIRDIEPKTHLNIPFTHSSSASAVVAWSASQAAIRDFAFDPTLEVGQFDSRTLRCLLADPAPEAFLVFATISRESSFQAHSWLLQEKQPRAKTLLPLFFLRQLEDTSVIPSTGISKAVALDPDPRLCLTLLQEAERRQDRRLLGILVQRLTAQAEGTLPLERDETFEHRFLSGVFESPYLSPTPLRPLAQKLKDRVTPLCRGPIERFLTRVGTIRPDPMKPEELHPPVEHGAEAGKEGGKEGGKGEKKKGEKKAEGG